MLSCTFFGHRRFDEDIEPILTSVLKDMIENRGVGHFYVGNNGKFDRLVCRVLENMKEMYPQISYHVVLAYMPGIKGENIYKNALLPEGAEEVFPKFAISFRNKWMIEKSDFVIGFVQNSFGGAYRFFALAEKKGKKVLNIADML